MIGQEINEWRCDDHFAYIPVCTLLCLCGKSDSLTAMNLPKILWIVKI
jgi:hypothetical protein